MTTTGKITRATLKSFVAKNRGRLLIKVQSEFDGMTDAVEYYGGAKWRVARDTDHCVNHTLGITGLWTVGQSRDYFDHYEDEQLEGISCLNACGSWTVAVEK